MVARLIVCLSLFFLSFLGSAEGKYVHTFDDYWAQIYKMQHFPEEEDIETIKERLHQAYVTPLDLNSASRKKLASLFILSEDQLNSYFKYISDTGPLHAINELQAIDGFDSGTIECLRPFVTVVEASESFNRDRSAANINFIVLSFAPYVQKKPNNKASIGDLNGCTLKCVLHSGEACSLHITARKQKGEQFCFDYATHRYGFNVWSVSLMVTPLKYIKRLIIGDYQIGYGQGLLFSAGYHVHTGCDMLSMVRSVHMGIRKYSGRRRVGLRGIACTSVLGKIEITGFYALQNLDARMEIGVYPTPYTSRIDDIGVYDTMQRLQKKHPT